MEENNVNNDINKFKEERINDIRLMNQDKELKDLSLEWMIKADKHKYSYNFSWLGRPIIKYPGDIVATQEIIWETKPDLIIETGIAHGGSLMLSASILELIGHGEVVGIDIDIREHNRAEIEKHPLFKRITMIEGSSVDLEIFKKVEEVATDKKKVMILLDSNHTHEHVLNELKLYSKLVSVGSYLVIADTFVEFFPKGYYSNRPWDVGNNPMTALREFMKDNDDFIVDDITSGKILITETFNSYLKRVK